MKKYSIMIVEDDPTFTAILESIIEEDSRLELVEEVGGSVEMARAVTIKKPDILILDVEIHGLSGLEVFEMLDQKPYTIVLSAKPEYQEEALSLGANHFLLKPLKRKEELLDALKSGIHAISD